MRKGLVAVVFAWMLIFAGRAHAGGTGYLCQVDYFPQPSANGNYGYIWFSVTSGINCTGTYSFTVNACSTGGSCSTSYTENGLLALYQTLHASQQAGHRVYVSTGGTTSTVYAVEFYGN